MKKLFAAVEERFAADFESRTRKDEEGDNYFAAVMKLIEFEAEVGVEQGERLQWVHKELMVRNKSNEQLISGHLEYLRSMQSQVDSILLVDCLFSASWRPRSPDPDSDPLIIRK